MHIFFNFIFAAVSDSTSDDLGDKPVQFSSGRKKGKKLYKKKAV